MLLLSGWGVVDLSFWAQISCVRSELLEVSEGLVCVLSLSEDHCFLPVFLEVWEVQLPAESRLDSSLIPRKLALSIVYSQLDPALIPRLP